MKTFSERLEEGGGKALFYYYLRDEEKPNRPPVISVCLYAREGSIYRGLSICSIKDNCEKARGRRLALSRAITAWLRGGDIEPINRWEARNALSKLGGDYVLYKGEVDPSLTPFERKITGLYV